MPSTAKKCLTLLGEGQTRRWFLLVVVALFASGFEMMGAALILVLTSLAANPDAPINLPVLGDVRDLVRVDNADLLPFVLVGVAAFFVVRGVVFIGQAYIQQRIAQTAGAMMATRLVRGYLAAPYSFHLRRNSSELVRNASTTVNSVVDQVLTPAVTLLSEVLIVTSLLLVLVAVAPTATALAVLILGPLVVLLLRVIQPRLKSLGRTTQNASGASIQALQQGFGGVRDIRLLGRERTFTAIFEKTRFSLARAAYLRAAAMQVPRTMIETVLVLFILGLLGVALLQGQDAGASLSLIGLFAYAGLRLQPSLQKVVNALNSIRFNLPAIDDLYGDLIEVGQAGSVEINGGTPVPLNRALVLRDVSFTYESVDRPALFEINLTIQRGESIGVCGPTGGGKSTLIDVIVGLLQPQTGEMILDEVPISRDLRGWQAELGVVSQSIFLLDDTLRANIAFGVESMDIDEHLLEDAVRLAQITDYVAALPEGLGTVVGERGVRLSGGQRQRIAIARALYRRPSVLVFDEGTSALDSSTETALISALEDLRGERTLITVAHRLSTVRKCDRIVFVEGGRIADIGTFEMLTERNAAFRAMATG